MDTALKPISERGCRVIRGSQSSNDRTINDA